jgi:hypothetical protein
VVLLRKKKQGESPVFYNQLPNSVFLDSGIKCILPASDKKKFLNQTGIYAYDH